MHLQNGGCSIVMLVFGGGLSLSVYCGFCVNMALENHQLFFKKWFNVCVCFHCRGLVRKNLQFRWYSSRTNGIDGVVFHVSVPQGIGWSFIRQLFWATVPNLSVTTLSNFCRANFFLRWSGKNMTYSRQWWLPTVETVLWTYKKIPKIQQFQDLSGSCLHTVIRNHEV